MIDREKCWYKRKFALFSIGLSFLEIGSFLLAALLIDFALVNAHPYPSPGARGAPIYRFLAGVWLFGTVVTFISAVMALVLDSRRGLAVIALTVSMIVFVICGPADACLASSSPKSKLTSNFAGIGLSRAVRRLNTR
jgi:hypothetical protein